VNREKEKEREREREREKKSFFSNLRRGSFKRFSDQVNTKAIRRAEHRHLAIRGGERRDFSK